MPSITDIEGITVGHWTDDVALTGCTVVLPPPGTIASCEVRGGAPGTRGTDILQPGTIIEVAHAIVLTGGSAFGLATAGGVERYLEERGIGSEIGPVRVPTVPAAVIFDLGVGDPTRRPGADEGYEACVAASADVAEGRVGVGTGATVAKLWGPERAMPGGVGTWSAREVTSSSGPSWSRTPLGRSWTRTARSWWGRSWSRASAARIWWSSSGRRRRRTRRSGWWRRTRPFEGGRSSARERRERCLRRGHPAGPHDLRRRHGVRTRDPTGRGRL